MKHYAAVAADLPVSYFHGEPLHIENEIQLLVDDYVVEDRWKLKRTNGTVMKFLHNPVIIHDKPWEGEVGGARQYSDDPSYVSIGCGTSASILRITSRMRDPITMWAMPKATMASTGTSRCWTDSASGNTRRRTS